MKIAADAFTMYGPKASDLCWQIDNDNLPSPHDDGRWESALAFALRELAESNESGELAVFTWSGNSVDFGHPGFSVWLALSGSPPLVKAARDRLIEIIEPRYRRSDTVHPHASWQARIRILKGQVWVPEDAATWVTFDLKPSAENDDVEDDDIDESGAIIDDFEELPPDEAKSPPKARRGGLRQSFHYNVRLSYYQRKIELLGGMPEGSVRFLTPDGQLANPNMHVGTLRRKWEDEAS